MSNNTEPQRKIYLLDEEECPPCDEVKEAIKDQIESGKVQVLKVTSDEALALLERAGVKDKVEFPTALIEDDKGVNYCQIYQSKGVTLAACGNEIVVIRESEEEPSSTPEPEESPPPPTD